MQFDLKYEVVASALREEIGAAEGRFLASERMLTERFSVDRSTIRRALEMLEGEGLILRRPGRRTEIVTRAAAPVRTPVALVVNASPHGWATLPLLHGAESVLTAHGCELSLFSSFAADPFQAERRERERLDHCLARRVAGVILWPGSRNGSRESLARLGEAGIPVVLVDQQLPDVDLDFVGIDNVAAAFRATEHLIRAGHRRIAHLTRANTMPTTLQRIEGYCRALESHGLPFEERWLRRCNPGRSENEAVDQMMTWKERPSALLAINDMTALRLLHHLVRRKIAVPEQMAVMGIDDLPHTELSAVPLSTIHQPFEEMGAEAARLLLERVEKRRRGPPECRLLPTRVVVRGSCGAHPVESRP